MRIILKNIYNSEDSTCENLIQRYNHGFNFEEKPHFLIDKLGNITNITQPSLTSDIIIGLVNEGCLFPLENTFVDLYNNLYRGEIVQRSYKNYEYWATYSNIQYEGLAELCISLFKDFQIENKIVNSNIYKEKLDEGVVSISNTTKTRYDLTPSFDFEKLENYVLRKSQKI